MQSPNHATSYLLPRGGGGVDTQTHAQAYEGLRKNYFWKPGEHLV